MRPRNLVITALLPMTLWACAAGSLVHLNDPARSRSAIDVANLLATREIPYETKEHAGIAVSYNLFFVEQDNFSGFRLTLVLRNGTDRSETFTPEVLLRDATGLVLQPDTYGGFMSRAAALAGAPVPPMPVAQHDRYYHQGSLTSPTGRTYRYSGTTVPSGGFAGGFAGGFSQGMVMGAAARSARNRREGHLMLRWGDSYWLKERYTVPPKSAVAGALFFSSSVPMNLPLSLIVTLSQGQFEFETVSSVR